MGDKSFVKYSTGANRIAESEHRGYSYKTATSLIENVIAKKEFSLFSEIETDGQLAVTSASQEYVDRRGKRVNLTPIQMKLVTAFYEKVKNLYVDYIQFRPIEQKGEPKDYSGIVAAVEKLQNDQRVYKSFKYDLVGWVPEKCWANWAAICVNVQGDVLYCCHRPDEKIGSVFDEDILEKLQSYEPDMSLCESPCRLSGANRFVEQMDIPRDIFFI